MRTMNRPRSVLITGCAGMLGNAIYPCFEQHCDAVFATDKVRRGAWVHQLDVRDLDSLREAFRELRPDLVLHLAAETDLEYCETHPRIAGEVNARATRHIAELSERHGSTLVYIST